MYGFKILFNEIPDEYKATISELLERFDVNHVVARNKNNGNKLDEK